MPESLQFVVLNALFLIAPLFLLQLIDESRFFQKYKMLVSFAAAAVMVVACMSFPIPVSPELSVDLRWMPILLTHVYVGPLLSAPLAAVMLGYKAFLGGEGILPGLMSLLVFLLPSRWFLHPGWTFRGKVLAAGAVSSLFAVLCAGLLFGLVSSHELQPQWYWFLPAVLAHGVVASGVTALVEQWTSKEERKRRQRERMSERLEKYDLVSQLAASVSHEVRNPLTVTRGFLQLLRSGGQTEREREQYIALALEELDRAQGIISDYLAFAKQDPGQSDCAVFLANEELNGIASVVTPYALIHSVRLETCVELGCAVYGNAGKFRQSVLNLCKNAIESMPRGGTLRIVLERNDGAKEVTLAIEDEGVGMTREQMDRIGTPYVTTKEKGTGLGLSVVSRTVEEMGGRLQFRSEVGRGTVAYVRLPLREVASGQAAFEAEAAAGQERREGGYR
ncbi:HAMP domain-containing sensor histidine kinase [Paenibacillus sp.]|uniref:HAMP domain-containing sensor histidine kinase n=1 Tax=Paenibacillus sp. TaxID=58172 RepID=UPI002D5717E7|nr:HAMP domain-containing sensor histidine kinase [Paenibacillus sp.]HZG54989.1 HAMP domain-containing sensor histidine kinase [Paenibacillus sp.]